MKNKTKYYLTLLLLKYKQEKGFTLIELLVVVIILGIFAVLAIPNYFSQIEKARETEAMSNLGTISRVQQVYYFEEGSFADSLTKLGLTFCWFWCLL